MTFLANAVDWLSQQMQHAAGQTVSIRRGAATTAGIIAVADSANYEIVDTEGMINRVRYRDWFISMADYAISGEVVEPRNGDRVIDDDGGEWAVTPIDQRDAYEDHDGGITWLLHTRRVKV